MFSLPLSEPLAVSLLSFWEHLLGARQECRLPSPSTDFSGFSGGSGLVVLGEALVHVACHVTRRTVIVFRTLPLTSISCHSATATFGNPQD